VCASHTARNGARAAVAQSGAHPPCALPRRPKFRGPHFQFGKTDVLVPIHEKYGDSTTDPRNHWYLIIIKICEKRMLVADSLQKEGGVQAYAPVTDALCKWLNALHREFHSLELGATTASWVSLVPNMPQQTGGVACGMFTLCAARHFVLGRPLQLSTEDAQGSARHVVAADLSLPLPQ